jgi:protein phosphatase
MKVLIVSDIHANYPALQAVLNSAVDFDKLIFLGDVVDYGPHPKECLTFIKENADYYIRGNHDNTLVVNPGSVGLARDGGQACYAVYENEMILLKRISYDVENTIADLMRSPLPKSTKDGLRKLLLYK